MAAKRRSRAPGGWGAGPIRQFLEPCLLLLLHQHDAHGYEMMEELTPFGLGEVDISLVYRTLRRLERQGFVTSSWQTGRQGGLPKRVYRLTAMGNRYLADWVAELREADRVLHYFLERYEEHMREGKGAHH